MNAHNTDSEKPADSHQRADSQTAASPDEEQTPAATPEAAPSHSQAARSVMHPEWQDPEWRYYHGAWGG